MAVDFDNGDGYYCWKCPEVTILHYHCYDEGFAGRMTIVCPGRSSGTDVLTNPLERDRLVTVSSVRVEMERSSTNRGPGKNKFAFLWASYSCRARPLQGARRERSGSI